MRFGQYKGQVNRRIFTVLDIGTSKVCCLIARVDPVYDDLDDEPVADKIHVVGFGYQRSSGMKAGVVVDMEAAEQSVRSAVSQAERMASLEVEEVILSVACGRLQSENFCASEMISGHAVTEHDVDCVMTAGREYAIREGRSLLHMIPISYILDENGGIEDPRGMIGKELTVDLHAVTVDPRPLRNLSLVVERCHLSIAGTVVVPYASGLATIVQDEAKLGVTCIDIGGGTTTFSVFAEGHFIYSDAIAIGGHQVTLHLARTLSTPPSEAERIKTLYGSAMIAASDEQELISFPTVGDELISNNQISRAQLGMIIRPRMEELLRMIQDRLAASGVASYAGQRVVLTGGASQLPGLVELAAQIMGKSVRIGRPRLIAGLPEHASGPEFAASIGLLLYPFQPHSVLGMGGEPSVLRTGTGYLARVCQWFKESF